MQMINKHALATYILTYRHNKILHGNRHKELYVIKEREFDFDAPQSYCDLAIRT